jgi:RND family efflux transporter MFP subunit
MNPAQHENGPGAEKRKPHPLRFAFKILFGVVLPVVVLAASAYAAKRLIDTSPQADRRGGGRRDARLVETMAARPRAETLKIEAMGTVRAARAIQMRPRVGGTVIDVESEFIPGGQFAEGKTILRLDPTDYELGIKSRQAELAKAESALKLEAGQQAIAQQEYELLGQSIETENRDLMLRGPQLEEAQANIDTARTSLESARLDLERTTIRAPFDAVVLSRGVELGMQTATTTDLAELAWTGQFWVVLSLPVEDLQFIDVPLTPESAGSPVTIHNPRAWGAGQTRQGRVLRLNGQLDERSRMAEIIVAIDDPLALRPENAGKPPLLLNAFVRGEIEGLHYDAVYSIPREVLREGEVVWVLNEHGKLEIRPVTILYRGRREALIGAGLRDGEEIVTTDLMTAVEGMDLRTSREGDRSVEFPEETYLDPTGEEAIEQPAPGARTGEGATTASRESAS